MKKLMFASFCMSLVMFSNAYSQNSKATSSPNYNRNSYWQDPNQVAQNADSEPTRIYPTERGSSSGFTAAAREDRLYQSRGYPKNPSQDQTDSNNNQYAGNSNQYQQRYANQNPQAYQTQEQNSQVPYTANEQILYNDPRNYNYGYR
jgi:hypothetical protein